ncbi:hypothetical protein ACFXKR_09490 [Streptomyces violascens]|uniref:hypothetical protein n=1 Tax=Streptomyces violascens TaxID=67381 RepID=UPI00367F952F
MAALLSALLIGAVAPARLSLGLDVVGSFWIAYILTRPLGASMGDSLSQPTADGGLGLGTVVTSALFLIVILGPVGCGPPHWDTHGCTGTMGDGRVRPPRSPSSASPEGPGDCPERNRGRSAAPRRRGRRANRSHPRHVPRENARTSSLSLPRA